MNTKSKRSRVSRACDSCRCDGPLQSQYGLKCSNCEINQYTCTYVEELPKTQPTKSYVKSLETRCATLEMLLNKFAPNYDYQSDLVNLSENSTINNESDNCIDSNIDNELNELNNKFKNLFLVSRTDNNRYYGSSSAVSLMMSTFNYKNDDKDNKIRRTPYWKDDEWMERELEDIDLPSIDLDSILPPLTDLLSLIDVYFKRINIFYPLFNYDNFMDTLHSNNIINDVKFTSKLLLMLAITCKYLNDEDSSEKYYRSFNTYYRKLLFHNFAPLIDDIQAITLINMLIHFGSFSKASWVNSSYGLVLCQDIGLHTKSGINNNEDSLRTFWSLYIMDRFNSALFGKSCALNDDIIDVDLPSTKNDIKDKESGIHLKYFVNLIKLSSILGNVIDTLYLKKTSHKITDVANLVNKTNRVFDRIDPELSYKPNSKDICQAYLRIHYHLIQIYIHRLFLQNPKTPLRQTAISVCVNASRSIIEILNDIIDLKPYMDIMISYSPFIAIIVLIIASCEYYKDTNGHLQSELFYVSLGMDILKKRELNGEVFAGKSTDFINQIIKNCSIPVDTNAHEPLNINNYLQLLEATKMANVIEDMLNTQPSESQSYSQQLPLSNSLIGNESQLLNNNNVEPDLSNFLNEYI